ncbi:hypothetical protein [Rhodoferax sp. PAMC 29310]|uniref:hypothetical protein n=1 Tax=Rhodoferax sp. PAMC 29310 TaxID=2822760 RepID=UPI001B32AB3D|nr:hypothetical protein [Rhodoferax sp. PAMC 29310]
MDKQFHEKLMLIMVELSTKNVDTFKAGVRARLCSVDSSVIAPVLGLVSAICLRPNPCAARIKSGFEVHFSGAGRKVIHRFGAESRHDRLANGKT